MNRCPASRLRALPSSGRRLVAIAGLAAALALAGAPAALASESSSASSATADAAQALSASADLAATASTLAEDELDLVVGSYTYGGASVDITAREAIEDAVGLASVQNDDGSYTAPTADMVLTYARNQILNSLVAEAGIEVPDDELNAYAEQNVGTSDIATIATYYQMDEDQARRILIEAAGVVKLRDAVVGSIGAAPLAPDAPAADVDATAATAEYASYVLDLVGDEWDTRAGAWASEDGTYAQALAASGFDGATASYETAQTAYYVAYSLYQQAASEQRAAWTAYVNDYLGQARITIATLRS